MTSNEINVVNKIRAQYEMHNKSKLDELKSLDKSVKKGARVFSYAFGTVSSLVLGTGMCLAMQIIGSGAPLMIAGVLVGVVGIGLVSATYPIYKKMLENSKKKNASKIVELSNQILNNN